MDYNFHMHQEKRIKTAIKKKCKHRVAHRPAPETRLSRYDTGRCGHAYFLQQNKYLSVFFPIEKGKETACCTMKTVHLLIIVFACLFISLFP